MRRYVQQRRQDGIARLSTRTQVGGWVRGKAYAREEPHQKVREAYEDDLDRPDTRALAETHISGPAHDCSGMKSNMAKLPNTNIRGSEFSLSSSRSQRIGTADPRVMPSSPGADPFDSYPFKLSQSDHSLIYHCKLSSNETIEILLQLGRHLAFAETFISHIR